MHINGLQEAVVKCDGLFACWQSEHAYVCGSTASGKQESCERAHDRVTKSRGGRDAEHRRHEVEVTRVRNKVQVWEVHGAETAREKHRKE